MAGKGEKKQRTLQETPQCSFPAGFEEGD